MSEEQQIHIPATLTLIEQAHLAGGRKGIEKPNICVKNKELTFGKISQSPLQEMYGGTQSHLSPTRT